MVLETLEKTWPGTFWLDAAGVGQSAIKVAFTDGGDLVNCDLITSFGEAVNDTAQESGFSTT